MHRIPPPPIGAQVARRHLWSAGFAGQLGELAALNRSVPTLVAGVPPAQSVAAGLVHSCARTASSASATGRL
jgi:hypothetical protein